MKTYDNIDDIGKEYEQKRQEILKDKSISSIMVTKKKSLVQVIKEGLEASVKELKGKPLFNEKIDCWHYLHMIRNVANKIIPAFRVSNDIRELLPKILPEYVTMLPDVRHEKFNTREI